MKKAFKIAIVVLICLGFIALTALYISNHTIDVWEPKGMIGEKEAELLATASLLMLIVVIPVFILTWIFAWKYRESNKSRHEPDWEHNYIAEYCWWGVPIVIIIILAVTTWKSTHDLNPFTPIENGKKPITIQVVALDWKWLFLYPEQGIATVNFVQFPEKTPISFSITSDAPMNSFWIPQLGGQIYAMPAMRSKLHLIANETGTFKGVSANLSGTGFAGMRFTAQASTDAEFDQWVLKVKQTGKHLNLDSYKQLAEPSEYNPVEYYILDQPGLFDWILMKYMSPEHSMH
ncbi:MAG: ubiquinol oxidase subunit II [Verrucomicrobia bacterium]|nr:ubiquinol oxidase subunit II [Verrucomicrobiota bacterium]